MSNLIDELLCRPIPEKLWHYTSIQGFHGIVASKCIFATDVRFLNDREEFIHAQKIADRMVSAAPELDADGFPDREWLARAVSLAFTSQVEVFVACFTAAEDQLGQWRAYSHGSSGVSLAFDLRAIRPPASAGTLVAFAPCIYDPEKKKELLLNALRPFLEEVRGYYKRVYIAACELNPEKRLTSDKAKVVRDFLEANPTEKAAFKTLVNAVVKTRVAYLQMAALLKHESFEEENEWRLVLPVIMDRPEPLNNPPQFRPGKTTLIPHVAHPFSADKRIVDVILGPGSDDGAIFAAQRFLKSAGLDLEPRPSKVPYRTGR